MKLSLIVPTYKKEKVVAAQIEGLYKFLSEKGIDFELLIVIDGIVDNSKQILEQLIKDQNFSRAKIYTLPQNRGKGYAVRYGFKKATGDVIGFIDADLDIKIKSLDIALDAMSDKQVDAVIPSRYVTNTPREANFKRKLLSKGLIFLNKNFISIPEEVSDISCGLKLFRREALDQFLPKLKVDRFAIDTELLYWINELQLKIKVTPFYSEVKPGSTSANPREILTMIKDILRIAMTGWGKSIRNSAEKTSPKTEYISKVQENA